MSKYETINGRKYRVEEDIFTCRLPFLTYDDVWPKDLRERIYNTYLETIKQYGIEKGAGHIDVKYHESRKGNGSEFSVKYYFEVEDKKDNKENSEYLRNVFEAMERLGFESWPY